MPTEKQLETMRANGRKSMAKRAMLGNFSPENQSRRRLNQIASEEAMAQKLRAEGFDVFSPTVVCDRVAIKDGKVFFVEFKKQGQPLRQGQQAVCDLVPEMYLIRYE
ncbi:MAG: hypothetical protein M0Z99_33875 [Betaproteobacteria bacterium]|nr:hypothetical protein [Betaproteobacteria bacterium]